MFVQEAVSELVEAVTWREVSPEVHKVNPEFARVLDGLSNAQRTVLYKVRYPYGQKILKRGCLQLPSSDGRFLPVTAPEICSKLQSDLAYIQGMPAGVLLSQSIELCISINGNDKPYSIMRKGQVFGLWAVLDPDISCERGTMWNITAGARSIFMLPKITDSASHKRLQRMCGILSPAPKQLMDHWKIFTELSSHNGEITGEKWSVELLFFSKGWVEMQNDALWQSLRLFLYSRAWYATAFLRNQFIYDVEFYGALENNNLKPDPYLADTVRYNLNISAGTQAGFGVARDDTCAPIKLLQKIYTEIYGLSYAPTIMHPMYLEKEVGSQPVYYSLYLPTLGVFSPKGRKLASKKYNLKEIKYVMQKASSEFSENKFGLECSPVSLYNFMQTVDFKYFHTEDDQFGEIQHSREIVHFDDSLRRHLNEYPHLEFCNSSMFLCGCIQISRC